nr:Chain C, Nef MW9 peptide from Protein Nef [Simian immunodeficiency virus]
MHPAQTSQW